MRLRLLKGGLFCHGTWMHPALLDRLLDLRRHDACSVRMDGTAPRVPAPASAAFCLILRLLGACRASYRHQLSSHRKSEAWAWVAVASIAPSSPDVATATELSPANTRKQKLVHLGNARHPEHRRMAPIDDRQHLRLQKRALHGASASKSSPCETKRNSEDLWKSAKNAPASARCQLGLGPLSSSAPLASQSGPQRSVESRLGVSLEKPSASAYVSVYRSGHSTGIRVW